MVIEGSFFMLSIDVELLWGLRSELESNIRQIYPYISFIPKSQHLLAYLLTLLNKYQIPATWAVVGGSITNPCQDSDQYLTRYFDSLEFFNPCLHKEFLPLWQTFDIVDKVLESPLSHEIAAHSYTHPDFWKISMDTAEIEIRASKRIFKETLGVDVNTFIFPKNHINYLGILRKYSFKSYRGKNKGSISFKKLTNILYFVNPSKLSVSPRLNNGLWEIPGSLLFQSTRKYDLYRIYITAFRNIKHVIEHGGIFHLMIHDYSLVPEEVKMLFTKLIRMLGKLNDKEKLVAITMKELVKVLEKGNNYVADKNI